MEERQKTRLVVNLHHCNSRTDSKTMQGLVFSLPDAACRDMQIYISHQ